MQRDHGDERKNSAMEGRLRENRQEVSTPPWQRVRLLTSFLILMIPVFVLSLASSLLWRAIARATPETFDDIHFWFYFFDVGREINVPTWFSAGLWIVIGLLAGYYSRRAARFRVSWGFFSFLAIFLSLDETLELHERLDVIGAEMAKHLPVEPGFTWVLPGVLIAVVLCVASLLHLIEHRSVDGGTAYRLSRTRNRSETAAAIGFSSAQR